MAMSRFCHHPCAKEKLMLDAIFIVLGVGFFAAATLYTVACDRL
jgi:hypothetical protein